MKTHNAMRPAIQPGETFEGPSKTLNDTHFVLFSAITGDVHPIHYDVEYASQTRFGKPLAHGLLLASLTALGASGARERIDGLVFLEQGSRFLRPATIGDTVRPELTLERTWQEEHRTFYRFTTRLLNQRDEVLVEGFHVYRWFAPTAAAQGQVK